MADSLSGHRSTSLHVATDSIPCLSPMSLTLFSNFPASFYLQFKRRKVQERKRKRYRVGRQSTQLWCLPTVLHLSSLFKLNLPASSLLQRCPKHCLVLLLLCSETNARILSMIYACSELSLTHVTWCTTGRETGNHVGIWTALHPLGVIRQEEFSYTT